MGVGKLANVFVFDFVRLDEEPEAVAQWIDRNRLRVTQHAVSSWSEHHGDLPPGLGPAGPLVDVVGFPVLARDSIKFPLTWVVEQPTGSIGVLAGELAVEPYAGPAALLELQGSCRELVGWMADAENGQARKVMLLCIRSFLAAVAAEIVSR